MKYFGNKNITRTVITKQKKAALLISCLAMLGGCYPEQGEVLVGLCDKSSNSVNKHNLLVKATLSMTQQGGCE